MPRNMSFALTTRQIRRGIKTVTRRLGWKNLRPGELFWAVEKAQGLKKGEKIKRLALLKCVSNRSVMLDRIDAADVAREGFAGMAPRCFVAMFMAEMQCRPSSWVRRIEFEYV